MVNTCNVSCGFGGSKRQIPLSCVAFKWPLIAFFHSLLFCVCCMLTRHTRKRLYSPSPAGFVFVLFPMRVGCPLKRGVCDNVVKCFTINSELEKNELKSIFLVRSLFFFSLSRWNLFKNELKLLEGETTRMFFWCMEIQIQTMRNVVTSKHFSKVEFFHFSFFKSTICCSV